MLLRGYYRDGDYQEMYRLDLDCFSKPFQFDLWTMKQAAEASSAIVAIAEEDRRDPSRYRMEGFVILHIEEKRDQRYAYLITIDVAPSARRSGIGSVMLTHAEQQARAAGIRRVALHVAIDNEPAIRFYERQQYERVGLAPGYYHDAGLDALIYRKQL